MSERKTLEELKAAALPRAKLSDIGKFTGAVEESGETIAAVTKAADAYLEHFLPPSERCIACDSIQGGLMSAIMGGGFTWGLAHGEGECSRCGWPARAYHAIDVPEVGKMRVSMILQYHPDGLERQSKDEDEEETANAGA